MPAEPGASDRRKFLLRSGAAALAASWRGPAAAAEDGSLEWRNRRPQMAYRRLGRTGFMISEIISGGNLISPDNYRHLVAAFELGLNYFDTAAAYGRGASEQGYRLALREVGRENVFLNTKVSSWCSNRNRLLGEIFESLPEAEQRKIQSEAREALEQRRALDDDYICHYFDGQQRALEAAALSNAVEKRYGDRIDRPRHYRDLVVASVDESLRRLGTDYLDLLMCPHGASTAAEVRDFPEIFEAYERLKEQGKVRFLAVSSHSDPASVIEGAVETGVYSAVMAAYNIVNARYVDVAIQKAHDADVGVIAMKAARPVHHGRNNGRPNDSRRVAMIDQWLPDPSLGLPQKCYLWALGDKRIAAVNSEMANLDMVRDNLALAGRATAA